MPAPAPGNCIGNRHSDDPANEREPDRLDGSRQTQPGLEEGEQSDHDNDNDQAALAQAAELISNPAFIWPLQTPDSPNRGGRDFLTDFLIDKCSTHDTGITKDDIEDDNIPRMNSQIKDRKTAAEIFAIIRCHRVNVDAAFRFMTLGWTRLSPAHEDWRSSCFVRLKAEAAIHLDDQRTVSVDEVSLLEGDHIYDEDCHEVSLE